MNAKSKTKTKTPKPKKPPIDYCPPGGKTLSRQKIDLLGSKKGEHGDWNRNRFNFSMLLQAADLSSIRLTGKRLTERSDSAAIVSLIGKIARVLTKDAENVSLDNWRDIPGYGAIEYNQQAMERMVSTAMSIEVEDWK